jgi:hypothetical protein
MTSEVRKQLDLLPAAQAHSEPVTAELIRSIRRRPTFLAAWNLAVDYSGLEDKQVYGPLGIDTSHWSKIRAGRAFPPADDRFVRFFDLVHNEIPLVWLVESRGYDFLSLRKHRSDEQRRIAELEQENRDLRRVLTLQAELQRGGK